MSAPFSDCRTIAFDGRNLLAGTRSSGVWKRSLTDFGITAMNEMAAAEQLDLYPNPSTGAVNISLPNSKGGNIFIYNMMGECIQTQLVGTEERINVSLGNAAKGVYSVEFIQGDKRSVSKLVVQ
jgi:hypothetical protein